ncbi:fatty acid amide hydrolase-like [Aristolochia californica]|uniref:fatty acid amide hydrolase-like n=1 Tax=Aristolochia californica TaxID=171875 RepID=UPI0035DF2F6E
MGFFGVRAKLYAPKEEVDLGPQSKETYLRANVKAPRMAGIVIKISVWLLESWIIGPIAKYILKRDNLIHKLISFAGQIESPWFVPLHPSKDHQEQETKSIQSDLTPPERVEQAMDCLPPCPEKIAASTFTFRRWTIRDYSGAYLSGETTPTMVVERLLVAVKQSLEPNLQMGFFIKQDTEDILKQATESTLRYERGQPISVLDGVPIAVKDEIDCLPYPTTGGTTWLHKVRPCKRDACCVQHLRSCGAILVGKTNMHELGTGISGINPHYGVTKNPYNIKRICGGSSSGSAAVVAAGLCPVALGVDGGGSVRLPAALCGVVGFKPTFGCISHIGALPLNWTVGSIGILAGTVEDALIVHAAISDHPVQSELAYSPPRVEFPQLKSTSSISNIKLAKYSEWFNDSHEEIRSCCDQALTRLSGHYGWKTVEVTLPDIEAMRLAHYLTIGSECTTSLGRHLVTSNVKQFGWDTRVAMSIYGAFNSKEYLNSQRLRRRQMYFHKEIFKKADVIVTPTTGVTAYSIQSDALETGELDYINGASLVRYMIAGNFLGLPAITVPIGYDKQGLPIGLQFIGQPWGEATLLHLAFATQAICMKNYRDPEVFFNLLKE